MNNDDPEMILLRAEVTRAHALLADARRQISDIWGLLPKFSTFADGDVTTGGGTVIGSAGEPPVGGYSGSWSPGSTSLDIYVSVGSAYYDAGDETLYGYKARLRFDSGGKLFAIDSLGRYQIDVPTT